MNIALIDVDGHNFPNLALMKISAWHKLCGDNVTWYSPLFSNPDKIYMSKVFTFTEDYNDIAPSHPDPIKGGTGYDATIKLGKAIELIQPDYSIYPDFKQAYGFLTRGCIRSCPWCIVPKKEGNITIVNDIEQITQDRKEVILMDNNFLASPQDFIINQLDKIAKLEVKIDFNQGLDARLINSNFAKKMSKVRWIHYIRFSCDTMSMIDYISQAISYIREAGIKKEIFCYMLIKDIEEAEERLEKLIQLKVTPFAQPYRDFSKNSEVSKELKDFARFVNVMGARLCKRGIKFKDYKSRKNINNKN